MTSHPTRRAAIVALAAPAFIRSAHAQSAPTRITYQTGWLPQPDKGGLYQALAMGFYRDAGLDVDLRAGGPQLNATQLFLAGKADFVDSDSTRVLAFAKDGLPGVAVAAFGQKSLTVLLSHPGTGHDTLESLKGQPLLVSTIGRQTYFPWLKARYGFTDAQARPYTFSMAPFLVDKNVSMEGFITSEPFQLRKAGVEPVQHLLADHGYEAYSNVILASQKMVTERPDVVQRFVDATARGWASYLNGDPKPGNDLIRKGNPEMTEDEIAAAREAMKKNAIFDSADVKRGGLGAMSDAQWAAVYQSMVTAGAMPAGVDPKKGYSLQFVNKRVAA